MRSSARDDVFLHMSLASQRHHIGEAVLAYLQTRFGTLIGEDGLVVMAAAESVGWYQTHGLMRFQTL